MKMKISGKISFPLWFFAFSLLISCHSELNKYYPVQSPKVKENIEKWQDIKFGLFMHWGPYSQWGIVESWALCSEDELWCRRENPNYEQFKRDYTNLKTTFNPVSFNPEKWAKAAKHAGMKYVVFTTKHHDGFNMFDTKLSDYKITSDSCPFHTNENADVTKAIFDAFRTEGFMIGAYLSKPDWNNENFWWPNFATPDRNVNYNIKKHPDRWKKYVDFFHGQINELMSNYGKIDILWLDGGWVRPLSKTQTKLIDYINSIFLKSGYTQLNIPQNQDLKMNLMAKEAREKQPGLIIVDRDIEGPNENYLTPEQFVPKEYVKDPWESCITLGGSWSYSFNANYKPARQVVHLLVDIVSKNGNLLLNVGPSPDGTWDKEVYERFNKIGDWMAINDGAIYETHGEKNFSEGKFRFTYGDSGTVNAIYLADENEKAMPEIFELTRIKVPNQSRIKLLGCKQELEWEKRGGKVVIHIPENVRQNPPCDFAWVFQISN